MEIVKFTEQERNERIAEAIYNLYENAGLEEAINYQLKLDEKALFGSMASQKKKLVDQILYVIQKVQKVGSLASEEAEAAKKEFIENAYELYQVLSNDQDVAKAFDLIDKNTGLFGRNKGNLSVTSKDFKIHEAQDIDWNAAIDAGMAARSEKEAARAQAKADKEQAKADKAAARQAARDEKAAERAAAKDPATKSANFIKSREDAIEAEKFVQDQMTRVAGPLQAFANSTKKLNDLGVKTGQPLLQQIAKFAPSIIMLTAGIVSLATGGVGPAFVAAKSAIALISTVNTVKNTKRAVNAFKAGDKKKGFMNLGLAALSGVGAATAGLGAYHGLQALANANNAAGAASLANVASPSTPDPLAAAQGHGMPSSIANNINNGTYSVAADPAAIPPVDSVMPPAVDVPPVDVPPAVDTAATVPADTGITPPPAEAPATLFDQAKAHVGDTITRADGTRHVLTQGDITAAQNQMAYNATHGLTGWNAGQFGEVPAASAIPSGGLDLPVNDIAPITDVAPTFTDIPASGVEVANVGSAAEAIGSVPAASDVAANIPADVPAPAPAVDPSYIAAQQKAAMMGQRMSAGLSAQQANAGTAAQLASQQAGAQAAQNSILAQQAAQQAAKTAGVFRRIPGSNYFFNNTTGAIQPSTAIPGAATLDIDPADSEKWLSMFKAGHPRFN